MSILSVFVGVTAIGIFFWILVRIPIRSLPKTSLERGIAVLLFVGATLTMALLVENASSLLFGDQAFVYEPVLKKTFPTNAFNYTEAFYHPDSSIRAFYYDRTERAFRGHILNGEGEYMSSLPLKAWDASGIHSPFIDLPLLVKKDLRFLLDDDLNEGEIKMKRPQTDRGRSSFPVLRYRGMHFLSMEAGSTMSGDRGAFTVSGIILRQTAQIRLCPHPLDKVIFTLPITGKLRIYSFTQGLPGGRIASPSHSILKSPGSHRFNGLFEKWRNLACQF